MASNLKKTGEHMFSIQLKSRDYLRSVALPTDEEGNVLIEGFLGKLESVNFTEGVMLEINGVNGSLRMDFTGEEFKRLLEKERSLEKNMKAEKMGQNGSLKIGVTDWRGGEK